MNRSSPSGPETGFLSSGQSGTVPVLAGAGSVASFTVTCPGAKVGDVAAVNSATLLAAGVVIQNGVSAADDAMTVNVIATKAYGGAALTDFILSVTRYPS